MSGDLRYKAASYIKFGEKKILVRKKIEKKNTFYKGTQPKLPLTKLCLSKHHAKK